MIELWTSIQYVIAIHLVTIYMQGTICNKGFLITLKYTKLRRSYISIICLDNNWLEIRYELNYKRHSSVRNIDASLWISNHFPKKNQNFCFLMKSFWKNPTQTSAGHFVPLAHPMSRNSVWGIHENVSLGKNFHFALLP